MPNGNVRAMQSSVSIVYEYFYSVRLPLFLFYVFGLVLPVCVIGILALSFPGVDNYVPAPRTGWINLLGSYARLVFLMVCDGNCTT